MNLDKYDCVNEFFSHHTSIQVDQFLGTILHSDSFTQFIYYFSLLVVTTTVVAVILIIDESISF